MKTPLFIRGTFPVLLAALGLVLLPPVPYAGEKPPYGDTERNGYGERKPVKSLAEAKKALSEFFAKKQYKVGKLEEKEFFFEAEILDKGGKVVDKVIIDKRTGRIRSIY